MLRARPPSALNHAPASKGARLAYEKIVLRRS